MENLQLVNNEYSDKYDEMKKYLNQNNNCWINDDKWCLPQIYKLDLDNKRIIDFSNISSEIVKLEVKYSIVNGLEKEYFSIQRPINLANAIIQILEGYIKINNKVKSILHIEKFSLQMFLLNIQQLSQSTTKVYLGYISTFKKILSEFYDDRDETEKDVWNLNNILGVRISASNNKKLRNINFTVFSVYYRECVKKYFRTIITKKSVSHCHNIYTTLRIFFDVFKELGYKDGFIENLKRDDIEKYIFSISSKYSKQSVDYRNKLLSNPRTFLEYIQMANYKESPKKDVGSLIFQNDIPPRERDSDRLQRVKFIPAPILEQIDNNISELEEKETIPFYVLLRETGWRGTDILNLRYDSCLEQIWNNKENGYNNYLCGEITKTDIAMLKVPIRSDVADMLKGLIDDAKNKSNQNNNPKKYLFNTYAGRRKTYPMSKQLLLNSIEKLIKEKNITDANGDLYHFNMHSLRHTRAKEYVEQGIDLAIIQQMLGHRSMQMTAHYAVVTENTLYEKWKQTEELELFKINQETNALDQIDLSESNNENLIKYEYVKSNLDAVRVPFGVCFKSQKMPCKRQISHCLTCASFCTTLENIPEYEAEIARVKNQIQISESLGRHVWAEKNKQYLELLEKTLEDIKTRKIIHKNGDSREVIGNG